LFVVNWHNLGQDLCGVFWCTLHWP